MSQNLARNECLQKTARSGLEVIVPAPTMLESLRRQGGVIFEEGLRLAGNRRMASNKRINEAALSVEFLAIRAGIPCWTGTIGACATPGRPLGDVLRYDVHGILWELEVPAGMRHESDVALAIEQPDYVIESKGTSRIIHATRIDVIPEFPVEKGFYVPDLRHGIPHGRSFPAEYAGAKYLSRDDTFVGPIIKRIMLYYGPVKRQDVSVEMRCSDNGLGVVVEDIRGELEAQ